MAKDKKVISLDEFRKNYQNQPTVEDPNEAFEDQYPGLLEIILSSEYLELVCKLRELGGYNLVIEGAEND